MPDINDTLQERGSRYGSFATQSQYAQGIKRVMLQSPNWAVMDDDMKECLDMMANKVGRILNGDPFYLDNWHDLVGYFKLVEQRLTDVEQP